ncbi:MAG: alanine racemase [Christensenella sp.]
MYRKTYAEINLDNLKQNIKNAAANLPETCGIVAVVKANAYGHGAVECSRAAKQAGACMLAVALAEEATELCNANIGLPIVIIGRSNHAQLKLAVELDLQPCIFTPDDIVFLQQECEKQNKNSEIHLKFDTGMCRIGIRSDEELRQCIKILAECERVSVAGVFTHFANSDAKNKHHAIMQHKKFMHYIDILYENGIRPAIHADNSAGTIDLPQFSHDMVRFGISMYGYYPSDEVDKDAVKLAPVMEVSAEISHIKTIDEGECVGYGSTFSAQRKTRVATVQIGYGDGYNRLLSNKGRMIVKTNKGCFYAQIIGRVCMDQTMLDITDVEGDVCVGDSVVVLGQRDDKSITADDIAKLCKTISYEVLLDFNERVPRIYSAELCKCEEKR